MLLAENGCLIVATYEVFKAEKSSVAQVKGKHGEHDNLAMTLKTQAFTLTRS